MSMTDKMFETMKPEAYAQALREQGIREEDIPERMAHDFLIAVASAFQAEGLPSEYHDMAQIIETHLMNIAKDETQH